MNGTEEYKKRVIDQIIARKLKGVGAILVEGPKWCGKTTTCEQFAKSVLYMADPDSHEQNLVLAETNVKELLKGEQPRLVDEWQEAPQLWDAVRFQVDHEGGWGHYLLTGSSVPPEEKKDSRKTIVHSGTGRIVRVKMRTMSLWESGESSGEVSLGGLFNGDDFKSAGAIPRTLRETAFLVCRGGWPQAVAQGGDESLDRALEYLDAVATSDVSRVDGVERNPDRVRKLLRSYARLQGTQALLPTIRRDILGGEQKGFDEKTLASYINALRKIFVIEDMAAWSPALRSKSSIRTSDTRYFSDPSIATAAMGLGPGDLMKDVRAYGYFFETMAVRDLRVYAEALGGGVSHFLDRNGLECDAVVHLRNGTSGLVEVKLGGDTLIEEGAATLNALSGIIDTARQEPVAFKMVLTATGDFAYRRPEDGVIVCPISALKP